jgi:hypothetical protein
MAQGNFAHVKEENLNHMDEQSLRAMLASIHELGSTVQALLSSKSPAASPTVQSCSRVVSEPSTTSPATPVPENADDVVIGESPATDVQQIELETEAKKNLPSPAATEDVISATQPEDKPVESEEAEPEDNEPALAAPGLASNAQSEDEAAPMAIPDSQKTAENLPEKLPVELGSENTVVGDEMDLD